MTSSWGWLAPLCGKDNSRFFFAFTDIARPACRTRDKGFQALLQPTRIQYNAYNIININTKWHQTTPPRMISNWQVVDRVKPNCSCLFTIISCVHHQVLTSWYRLPYLWKDHLHRWLGSGCKAAWDVYGYRDRGTPHPRRHLPSNHIFCDS